MAHMSQERKAKISAALKPILAKHNVKGSLSVHHHSTLVLTLTAGAIDFAADYNQAANDRNPWGPAVNPYHFDRDFTGAALAFLTEALAAMNEGNHDRSDISTDYFDVGWYVKVKLGRHDAPYVMKPAKS